MNDGGKKIDIKIMKLNRWYVPKSVELCGREDSVILGCFDELQVRGLNAEKGSGWQYPFSAGYAELITRKISDKSDLADYSAQEQILFLNVSEESEESGDGFSEKTVQDFWDDKDSSCPYLFLSIIVLFVKKMQIPDFAEKIKQLFKVSENEEKVIFDTFSMVSFYPGNVQNQAHEQSQRITQKPDDSINKQFQATINLSIRDHNAFEKWYQEEVRGQDVKIEYYNLFGRPDVSVTKEDADTEWLMQIMHSRHATEY